MNTQKSMLTFPIYYSRVSKLIQKQKTRLYPLQSAAEALKDIPPTPAKKSIPILQFTA